MRLRRLTLATALIGGSAAFAPFALAAGDAQRGSIIAKRWCASCHVVASDQTSASADAPSFFDIARRRTDRKKLGNFLMDPHPPMPRLDLSNRQIADLMAYLATLSKQP